MDPQESGNLEKARENYEAALELYRDVLGTSEHPSVASLCANVGAYHGPSCAFRIATLVVLP